MTTKYFVEVYEPFSGASGNKQFKLLDKKECETMQLAKDKIIEWVKVGHDESNIVLYAVQDIAFKIEYSVKFVAKEEAEA
jgi:hypothetical protein